MALFPTNERHTTESLADLTCCNPFDPAFVEEKRSVFDCTVTARRGEHNVVLTLSPVGRGSGTGAVVIALAARPGEHGCQQ